MAISSGTERPASRAKRHTRRAKLSLAAKNTGVFREVANQLTQAAFRFLFAPNVTYVGVQVRDLPGGFAQFVAESFVAPESIRVVQRSGESKVVVERSGAWLRTALADNTVRSMPTCNWIGPWSPDRRA